MRVPEVACRAYGQRGRVVRGAWWTRIVGGLVMVALALEVAACESGGTTVVPVGARATQTAGAEATRAADATAAQATRAAATVWLGLVVVVKGSAERGDAEMDVTVTVTNHTDAPVHIAGGCDRPPILLTILKKGGGYAYSNAGSTCALNSGYDLAPAVAAGASHEWTYPIVLPTFGYGYEGVPPGAYSVTAYVHDWHQGTFEDLFKSPPPLFGGAWVATTVTAP